jgi:trimeric autotransporter adhesin
VTRRLPEIILTHSVKRVLIHAVARPHPSQFRIIQEIAMKLCAAAWVFVFGVYALNVQGAQHASTTPERTSIVTATGATTESVPRLVQCNGTLKDAAARPLSGVASVTFAIYAEQDGGTALWSETQNVLSDTVGHFSVLLGSATANGVPSELFGTGQSRWLGVTIARSTEMPRVLLASVPYALKAADADTLGGLPASAYVTTESLAASNARVVAPVVGGSTTVVASPQIAGASSAAATQPAAQPISNAVAGIADYIPIWTSATAQGNSTIFETGGLVGIGTTTPAETLDVNGNSIFRGSFQLPPGHPAIASSGYESHSFQFQASSFSSTLGTSQTEAFGFRAEPLNNNTANPSAKLDLFFGAGGSAPFTDTGLSFAANGIVTFAPGQSFSGGSETLTGNLNLPNTTSSSQGVIALGGSPFISNFGSPSNTFVGQTAAGAFGSTLPGGIGGANTAVGAQAMFDITSGGGNTAVGASALYPTTTGNNNVALGGGALASNTTGSGNIGVGAGSGGNSATGSFNTFLGENSGVVFGTDPLTNATAIGSNSAVGASNTIVLGSIAGVENGKANVNVGIGTATPRSALELSAAGYANGGPSPTLTLTNTVGMEDGQVSIDFNTYGPSTSGIYNPAAKILALDDGNYSDYLLFVTNVDGARNNGMTTIMQLSPDGSVTIPGDLVVYGSVSKGSGSFKIDDPIDPGGKYLSHSFVESPDMMNIYNGNVVTDAKGYATVEMPAWFEALNGDFRYQLTAMNSFARATVVREIQDGKFRIRTTQPKVKVSWQVTGIRHDAYANAHRIPTEEEKPAEDQGHYMHPELFGAGTDKAIASTHPGGAANVKPTTVRTPSKAANAANLAKN